jgi:hypothetical protein
MRAEMGMSFAKHRAGQSERWWFGEPVALRAQ